MIKKIKQVSLILSLNIISNNIMSMEANDITQNKRKLDNIIEQKNQDNNVNNKKIKLEDNNIKEWQSANKKCFILEMPNELLFKFIKKLIKSSHIDNWNNIFEFDKELFKRNIDSICCTCKSLNNFQPDIKNITKKLKAKRFDDLKKQIKDQYKGLSKKRLNSQLIKILDQFGITRNNLDWNIARSSMEEAFKIILAGADIDTVDDEGYITLMVAAREGHENIVKLLIDNNANIDQKANNGETALMLAIINGHKAISQLLIDNGANVNEKNYFGNTALIWAIIYDHKDIVELLINNNANVNEKDNNGGYTALMCATMNGHTDIVQLLIDNKADVNEMTNDGKTALMLAARWGYEDIVELLEAAKNK